LLLGLFSTGVRHRYHLYQVFQDCILVVLVQPLATFGRANFSVSPSFVKNFLPSSNCAWSCIAGLLGILLSIFICQFYILNYVCVPL